MLNKTFENINESIKINTEKINLFSKINKINKEDNTNNKKNSDSEISFSDLNLKVGKIVEVEKIENSEKLYLLKIDFKTETRQIVSGLQKIYTIDELLNKKIVSITNLKETKLLGFKSFGMVLAADNPSDENDCELLSSNLEIGENLNIGNEIANSEKIMKSKKFSKYDLNTKENKIYFTDKIIENCFLTKNFTSKVY